MLNQKLLEEILAVQLAAEEKMLKKVANRVKRNITTPGWNEQKLADTQLLRQEIQAILNDSNKVSKGKISKNLLQAYESGQANVSKKLGMPNTLMKDIVPYHLQRLIMETQGAVQGTSFRILSNSMDIYRSVISEASTGVLSGVDTRMEASQNALNQFASKGITGFVDKAGRNWELASYVEMATRTATARAALQGHVDRSIELGQDLMMVSGHAATCKLCAPWGGVAISISGKTPGYPSLDMAKAAGLFHPNCKHTLTVWLPDLEGNVEHAKEHTPEPDIEKYNAIQRQRYNERQIRKYKRLEAVALDNSAQQKAHNKVREWQGIQRKHVTDWNFKRKYARESIQSGGASKAIPKPVVPKPMASKLIKVVDYEILKNKTPDILETEKTLKNVLSQGTPVININDSNLEKMLIDGYYKTQIETGTSGGVLSLDRRFEAESKLFGYTQSDKIRPTYGYLDDLSETPKGVVGESVKRYGGNKIVLKSDLIQDNTSFTFGDSLMGYEKGYFKPSPLKNPQSYSVHDKIPMYIIENIEEASIYSGGYVELQIHKRVSLEDIKEIIFEYEPQDSIKELLKQNKITWRSAGN